MLLCLYVPKLWFKDSDNYGRVDGHTPKSLVYNTRGPVYKSGQCKGHQQLSWGWSCSSVVQISNIHHTWISHLNTTMGSRQWGIEAHAHNQRGLYIMKIPACMSKLKPRLKFFGKHSRALFSVSLMPYFEQWHSRLLNYRLLETWR